MNAEQLKAWMAKTDARLDALEGKEPVEEVVAKRNKPKTEAGEFPKWVYRMVDGELQSALIERAEDLPDNAFESPEEAKVGLSSSDAGQESEVVADEEDKPTEVEIPDDWKEAHHSTRIKLAKSLPGGDDVVSAEDADAMIELEIERRGNSH